MARKRKHGKDKSKEPSKRPDKDEGESNEVNIRNLPSLLTRTCPNALCHAVQQMNDAQRKAVEEIGFGSILKLKVKELPQKMSYWIVNNLDPWSKEFKLRNGRRLHFETDDVERVMGFPRGPGRIDKITRSQSNEMRGHFLQKMEVAYNRISVSLVRDKMLSEIDGGIWFRRLFMILMTSTLIENSGNCYIFPQLLHYFDEVNNVRNYNWCDYIVRCVVDTVIQWQNHQHQHFMGPIFFLVIFYVDRVECFTREVPRTIPAFDGWTYSSLCKRQSMEIASGGFGGGYPCQPYTMEDYLRDHQSVGFIQGIPHPSNHNDEAGPSIAAQEEREQISHCHVYADKIISAAKTMAESMVNLMAMVEGAPQEMFENNFFKRTLEAAHNLLLMKPKSSTPLQVVEEEPTKTTQDDDEFWADPERIAAIEEITNAVLQVRRYEDKIDDMPSFSLGLTQEFERLEKALEVTKDLNASNIFDSTSEGEPIYDEIVEFGQHSNYNANCDELMVNENYSTRPNKKKGKKPKEDVGKPNQPLKRPAHNEKEVVNDVAGPMKTRIDTLKKPTEVMMSPYKMRIVEIKETITKAEAEVYFWLLSDRTDEEKEEIIYSDKKVTISHGELQTLKPNVYLSYAVIDVWSTILNHNERYKSKESPSRFFCTTNPSNYTVVNPDASWNMKKRMETFIEGVTDELESFKFINIANVDMFFFPIFQSNHYYLICIDFKHKNSVLIDNSSAFENEKNGFRHKYGTIPNNLIKFFTELMKKTGLDERVKDLSKHIKGSERLQLPWRDETNQCDCGVYVMRHMETYMGEPVITWKPGLKKKSAKQMRYLRMKYSTAILTSKTNIHSNSIVSRASIYYAGASKDGPVDVADMYLNKVTEKVP